MKMSGEDVDYQLTLTANRYQTIKTLKVILAMNTLVILTVLTFSALACAESDPVHPKYLDNHLLLTRGVFTPSGAHPNTRIGLIDINDLLSSDKKGEESDVYWRTWKGTIPKDAVIGAYGKTDCGSEVPIYMAQAFHKSSSEFGILPAKIFKKSKAVSVSYGQKQFRYKNNIKILCADDPSILTWVPVDEIGVHGLTEKDCVIAGAERTFNTFFGRTNYEDETVIGKVVLHSRYMYFPYYGEEEYVTKNFEILCNRKAVETKRIGAQKKKEDKQMATKEKETSDDRNTESIVYGPDDYIPDIDIDYRDGLIGL